MRFFLVLFVTACSEPAAPPPVESVPRTETIKANVSAPVDVVRDELGIPHIYGDSWADVAYAQGYVQAQDRLVHLDFARHLAQGTLAELAGELSESLIDRDIGMRLHKQGATAEEAYRQLQSSANENDKLIVRILDRHADGINAFIEAVKNSDVSLPPQLAFAYSVQFAKPFTGADALSIGRLLAFQQSYSCQEDIDRSAVDAAGEIFEANAGASYQARKGIAHDFGLLSPIDPTYSDPRGWSALPMPPLPTASLEGEYLPLYRAAGRIHDGVGTDRMHQTARGSNNWVVGPSLSSTGNVLVANDPHLSLQNPSIFHLEHLVVRGQLDVMGGALPGVPGVVLGMNRHLAWAATNSYVDTCDVYRETIVDCGGQKCVVFGGQQVPLTPRTEEIKVGRFGEITRSVMVTYYEVPHHGPIVPRIGANHVLEPLAATELSIRYTGYEPTQEVRAILGLDSAANMKEGYQALQNDFQVGGFNWVLGDDQGNFGWSEVNRIPRRAAGSVPWKVMPGDGSAEWGVDLPFEWIPHAFNHPQGFIATANNDPIGITADNDPLGAAPMLDGAPVYIGADYDPGTRIGRIDKRLREKAKHTLDDMQSIQADAITEMGQLLTPTLLAAATALRDEVATPGTHPELAAMLAGASNNLRINLDGVIENLTAWTFDTPAGVDSATPQEINDSIATNIYSHWFGYLFRRALLDEYNALGTGVAGAHINRLLHLMCTAPDKLATGLSAAGDSILFDDMNTPAVESKLEITAAALIDALTKLEMRFGEERGTWMWGRVHTLALEPLLPIDSLRVPKLDEAAFPDGGFPRHGANGTVDVADHGFSPDDFSYGHGASQRFVVELDREKGPRARNALPGGEVFDPSSPHYRDFVELWRKNQSHDYPYAEADVAAAAKREHTAHAIGRVRFEPK